MSQLTSERGEQKREEIRRILWGIWKECLKEKKSMEETTKIVNKHIEIMKVKNPRENGLVITVCCEIKWNTKKFVDRMIAKYGL